MRRINFFIMKKRLLVLSLILIQNFVIINAQDIYIATYKIVSNSNNGNLEFPKSVNDEMRTSISNEMRRTKTISCFSKGDSLIIYPPQYEDSKKYQSFPVTFIDFKDKKIYSYLLNDSVYSVSTKFNIEFEVDSTNIDYHGINANVAVYKSFDMRVKYKTAIPYVMPIYCGNILGTVYEVFVNDQLLYQLQVIKKFEGNIFPDLSKMKQITPQELNNKAQRH